MSVMKELGFVTTGSSSARKADGGDLPPEGSDWDVGTDEEVAVDTGSEDRLNTQSKNNGFENEKRSQSPFPWFDSPSESTSSVTVSSKSTSRTCERRGKKRKRSTERQRSHSRRNSRNWDRKLSPILPDTHSGSSSFIPSRSTIWSLILSIARDATTQESDQELQRKNLTNCVRRLPFFTSFELLAAITACATRNPAFLPFFINALQYRLIRDIEGRTGNCGSWDLPNLLLAADAIFKSGKSDSFFFKILSRYLDTVPEHKFNKGLSIFALSLFSKAEMERTSFIRRVSDRLFRKKLKPNERLSFQPLLPWERFQCRQLLRSMKDEKKSRKKSKSK